MLPPVQPPAGFVSFSHLQLPEAANEKPQRRTHAGFSDNTKSFGQDRAREAGDTSGPSDFAGLGHAGSTPWAAETISSNPDSLCDPFFPEPNSPGEPACTLHDGHPPEEMDWEPTDPVCSLDTHSSHDVPLPPPPPPPPAPILAPAPAPDMLPNRFPVQPPPAAPTPWQQAYQIPSPLRLSPKRSSRKASLRTKTLIAHTEAQLFEASLEYGLFPADPATVPNKHLPVSHESHAPVQDGSSHGTSVEGEPQCERQDKQCNVHHEDQYVDASDGEDTFIQYDTSALEEEGDASQMQESGPLPGWDDEDDTFDEAEIDRSLVSQIASPSKREHSPHAETSRSTTPPHSPPPGANSILSLPSEQRHDQEEIAQEHSVGDTHTPPYCEGNKPEEFVDAPRLGSSSSANSVLTCLTDDTHASSTSYQSNEFHDPDGSQQHDPEDFSGRAHSPDQTPRLSLGDDVESQEGKQEAQTGKNALLSTQVESLGTQEVETGPEAQEEMHTPDATSVEHVASHLPVTTTGHENPPTPLLSGYKRLFALPASSNRQKVDEQTTLAQDAQFHAVRHLFSAADRSVEKEHETKSSIQPRASDGRALQALFGLTPAHDGNDEVSEVGVKEDQIMPAVKHLFSSASQDQVQENAARAALQPRESDGRALTALFGRDGAETQSSGDSKQLINKHDRTSEMKAQDVGDRADSPVRIPAQAPAPTPAQSSEVQGEHNDVNADHGVAQAETTADSVPTFAISSPSPSSAVPLGGKFKSPPNTDQEDPLTSPSRAHQVARTTPASPEVPVTTAVPNSVSEEHDHLKGLDASAENRPNTVVRSEIPPATEKASPSASHIHLKKEESEPSVLTTSQELADDAVASNSEEPAQPLHQATRSTRSNKDSAVGQVRRDNGSSAMLEQEEEAAKNVDETEKKAKDQKSIQQLQEQVVPPSPTKRQTRAMASATTPAREGRSRRAKSPSSHTQRDDDVPETTRATAHPEVPEREAEEPAESPTRGRARAPSRRRQAALTTPARSTRRTRTTAADVDKEEDKAAEPSVDVLVPMRTRGATKVMPQSKSRATNGTEEEHSIPQTPARSMATRSSARIGTPGRTPLRGASAGSVAQEPAAPPLRRSARAHKPPGQKAEEEKKQEEEEDQPCPDSKTPRAPAKRTLRSRAKEASEKENAVDATVASTTTTTTPMRTTRSRAARARK